MPAKRVVRRPAALADLEQATRWYAVQGGVPPADEFVAAVHAGLTHVAAHPETGSARYGVSLGLTDLRCWALQSFPYLLCYENTAEVIDLWRVLHSARDIPILLEPLAGGVPDAR